MSQRVVDILTERGIQPSAQRVAVGEYVLASDEHPSADEVLERVRESFPVISRATVYNTLNLFVEKGLLQQLQLTEGRVVFDPKTEEHHHFVDEETGDIYDIPWGALDVRGVDRLARGFEVDEYQVVLRGRKTD